MSNVKFSIETGRWGMYTSYCNNGSIGNELHYL